MSPSRLALAFLAAVAPTAAFAAIFCPGNEAEFRQALATAAANGEDDEIRLRPGTFYTGGQKFAISSTEPYSLSISGGWTDHLPLWCSLQSPSASATVLDGQNLTAVLDIQAYAGSSTSAKTVSVGNLTIRNGYTSANGESAALRLAVWQQTLRLERTMLLSHTQATASGSIYNNAVTLNGSGDIYVLGNAMGDLHSNYANLAIFTQGGSGQSVYLTNNTLSLHGGGFNALLDANNGTNYRIVNNAILSDSGFSGLGFNSRNANDPIRLWAFNNLGQWGYSDLYNNPPRLLVQADSGNRTNVDPLFAGATDFRPAAGSPLVNAGLNSPFGGVPATDLDGHPRVDLGIIDAGAYESTRERIFANGFD